jgi:retinol dehydrogenase 12
MQSQKCDEKVMEVWKLDLGDYESVKAFARRCEVELERVDAVVENAGVVMVEYKMLAGHEATITTNVISTFLLGLLLLPKLKETAKRFSVSPHLVIVSSDVHYGATFNERKTKGKIFDELNVNKLLYMLDRYNVSKLLEVYVVREWAHKYMKPLEESGESYPVILNSLTPGMCHSDITRNAPIWYYPIITFQMWLLGRTTEEGSRALVHAASAGRDTHGEFLWDCKPRTPGDLVVGKKSEGGDLQRKVWSELSDILEEIEPGITHNF